MTQPVGFARLVAVELRRAGARRLVRVFILLAVLGIGIAGAVTFAHSSRTSASRVELLPGIETPGGCTPATATNGAVVVGPGDNQCLARITVDHARSFRYERLWRRDEGSLLGVLLPALILGGVIAAASFVGADWRFGTVGLLLTFEPRRTRALLAKVAAVALAAFVIAVALEFLLAAALWPAAHWRGTMEGVDAAWWRGALEFILRAGGVTVAFTLFGLAIGSIGRTTTAAVGAAFAYLFVGEQALHAVRPKWSGWLLVRNAVTAIDGRHADVTGHGPWTAAFILAGYVVVLLTVAAVMFARRDVT